MQLMGNRGTPPPILPPDAVRWRGICYGDVAVCVSVALLYRAQTTESIIMRPLPDCSPAVLVSHTKYEFDSSRGSASLCTSSEKKVR